MSLLKLLSIALANLPQILKLIEAMEAHAKEQAKERKVADDFKAIEQAFKTKDAAALDKLFSS